MRAYQHTDLKSVYQRTVHLRLMGQLRASCSDVAFTVLQAQFLPLCGFQSALEVLEH